MHWKLILGIRDTGQFWSMINVLPSHPSAQPQHTATTSENTNRVILILKILL